MSWKMLIVQGAEAPQAPNGVKSLQILPSPASDQTSARHMYLVPPLVDVHHLPSTHLVFIGRT